MDLALPENLDLLPFIRDMEPDIEIVALSVAEMEMLQVAQGTTLPKSDHAAVNDPWISIADPLKGVGRERYAEWDFAGPVRPNRWDAQRVEGVGWHRGDALWRAEGGLLSQ